MSDEKPHLFIQEPDPDIAPTQFGCSEWRGHHLCPTQQFAIATNGANVRIVLICERAGMYLDHTPQGARQLAEHLIRAADHLDAQLAQQAQALLQTTLAKRGEQ